MKRLSRMQMEIHGGDEIASEEELLPRLFGGWREGEERKGKIER